MIKNSEHKIVLFEKCYASELIIFKRAIVNWKNNEKLKAAQDMKQAFPYMGLYFIKAHLSEYPGYKLDFKTLVKEYLIKNEEDN